jgi:hypothetical protein
MTIEIASDNHIGSDECKKLDTKTRDWRLIKVDELTENWKYIDFDDDLYWACYHETEIFVGNLIARPLDFAAKRPAWATHILVIHNGK